MAKTEKDDVLVSAPMWEDGDIGTFEENSARCELVRRNALLREAGVVPRFFVPTRTERIYGAELVILAKSLRRQLSEPDD